MAKMKVALIVLALALFLGAMFFLGLFFKNKNGSALPGPGIISPTPFGSASTSTGPMAVLTRESGVVTYRLPGLTEFQTQDSDEIEIPTGTTVKTDSNALAHVVFPDNSLMSLSKDTEVTVNFEDKKIKITQILGNTWHRVEKVLQGNSYEVETPNTLATVRGTEFNVGVLPDGESEVYVMESVVDVSKLAEKDGQMEIEETEKVQKDKHIMVPSASSSAKMKLVDLPSAKKNSDWFQRNKAFTTMLKQAELDAEKSEASDGATVTSSPANMDKIKHDVRREMMKKLKNNTELKKIDAQFPTPTPVDALTPTQILNKRSDAYTQNAAQRVLGAKTQSQPTPTPTTTPITGENSQRVKARNSQSNASPTPTATLSSNAPTNTPSTLNKADSNLGRFVPTAPPTSAPTDTITPPNSRNNTNANNSPFTLPPTDTPKLDINKLNNIKNNLNP